MKVLFIVLAVLVGLMGFGIFSMAQSAIHEIEAFVLFLVASVFMVGAGVVEAVTVLQKKLIESLERLQKGEMAAPHE